MPQTFTESILFCASVATKLSLNDSYILKRVAAPMGFAAGKGRDRSMPEGKDIEKFAMVDLQELREGLLQQGLDSWQAADLIRSFLAGRGYGVSRQSARDAVLRAEVLTQSMDCMQAELEKLAMMM
ncbi:MAG: hypothetical protein ACRD28_06085 [Acidobacteriaceae bacterium]